MDVPTLLALDRSALPALEAAIRQGPQVYVPERGRTKRTQADAGRTAIIGIYGVLSQYPTWWGGTSTMETQAAIRSAASDPNVDRVILNIDSPGGSTSGVQELSDAIYAARQQKPIIALANSWACSGAYWIGSAASKMFCAPGGFTGSVGVLWPHFDISGMNEQMGVKPTYVVSKGSPFKTEGTPDEPLGKEARAEMQRQVDAMYLDFVRALARNRGVRPTEAMANFGQGRIVNTSDALSAKMIDGIATLEGLLSAPPASISSRMTASAVDVDLERRRWRQLQRTQENN